MSAAQAAIRDLEERGLNAWPALQSVFRQGWIVRFAKGYTKRANSACALGPDAAPLAEIGPDIEALYARHGQRAIFRLSPLASPEDDAWLAQRGYRRIEPTHVMRLADLPQHAPEPPAGYALGFADHADAAWIAGFTAGDRHGVAGRETLAAMLAAIRPQALFASLWHEGVACGYGIAVMERRGVGLFDIQIAQTRRGLGLGRFLVGSLLSRARCDGADHAWLQVLVENEVACGLYRSFGFAPVYDYVYRVTPG